MEMTSITVTFTDKVWTSIKTHLSILNKFNSDYICFDFYQLQYDKQ